MNYGMPYMGSKSAIAKWVVDNLPPADTWIEPFAGGCAVTHAAILSGKYKRFIINDITDSAKVFLGAIRGKFREENRWISRADFFKLKETDAYVRLCFSFGNDQKTYCYGADIEPYKRAFHYAVFFNDLRPFQELGVAIPADILSNKNSIYEKRMCLKKLLIRLRAERHAGDLQSLERLERLQSLERLERLERLVATQGDYRDVNIPTGNCVIYCDPPYRDTKGYLNEFNHEEFYEWAARQSSCFISEYNMPDCFRLVALKSKNVTLAANSNNKKLEGIWIHKSSANNMNRRLFNI